MNNNEIPSGDTSIPSGTNSEIPSGDTSIPSGTNSETPSGDTSIPSGTNSETPSGDTSLPSGRNKEVAKRYILFIISLFFSALGVAITKRGELGVSPISSVANILSYKFESLSMGTWLIIWNCVLVAGQIVILRKNFQPIQLLQVPLSFLFGWFTDFGMWIASFFPIDTYPNRLILVICGVVILGFGISLSVIANVIMNAGEAFVKAISDSIHKEFGNVKIAFDISSVTLSIILSLIFFQFTIVGTREGTIISAFLTGITVKFFSSRLKKPLTQLLVGKS